MKKTPQIKTGSGLWYVFTLFGAFKRMQDFSCSKILLFSEVMLSDSDDLSLSLF